MTTTAIAVTSSDVAWQYLMDYLAPSCIPEDLSEVDATWIYYTLTDSNDPIVEELAEELGWYQLDALARDFRDTWHEANCEQLYWERHGRFDHE